MRSLFSCEAKLTLSAGETWAAVAIKRATDSGIYLFDRMMLVGNTNFIIYNILLSIM